MKKYSSLGYDIAKVSKALRTQFNGLLKPYGVTVQQFEIMRILQTDSGVTAAQLVERIISDSSTIMSILKRMESKKLIHRKPDENDRRTKQIYLTSKGEHLVKDLTAIANQYNTNMQNCCSDEERQSLRQVLSKLYSFSKTDIQI